MKTTEVKKLEGGSQKYGPCEVCGHTVDTVYDTSPPSAGFLFLYFPILHFFFTVNNLIFINF